jgi:hypothetical protein
MRSAQAPTADTEWSVVLYPVHVPFSRKLGVAIAATWQRLNLEMVSDEESGGSTMSEEKGIAVGDGSRGQRGIVAGVVFVAACTYSTSH